MDPMNAETVWIENTQPRLIHLPGDPRKVGEHVVVGQGVQLTPSVKNKEGQFVTEDGKASTLNAVTKDVWNRKKNNAIVKMWLRMGWLKLHDRSTPGADMPDTLTRYNATTAMALLESEENVALLKQWKQTEGRADVAAAIDARIESVMRSENKRKG